jgi:hypothetical protein
MLQDALVYLFGKDILSFLGLMFYTFFLFASISIATSPPNNKE